MLRAGLATPATRETSATDGLPRTYSSPTFHSRLERVNLWGTHGHMTEVTFVEHRLLGGACPGHEEKRHCSLV
jgi:hypothetical protein